METSGGDGAMETVATREWMIREVDPDGVVVDRVPDGGRARFERSLFPDDVAAGDRFRVVAQVDRSGRRGGSDAPEPDASVRGANADGSPADAGGDAPADEPARSGAGSDDAPFEVPAAMEEALRNLS